MALTPKCDDWVQRKWIAVTSLSFLLFVSVPRVLAHAGHGDEFHQNQSAPLTGAIEVDEATVQRIGLKVEAVRRQSLPLGIQATGQIEALPSRKVEVTNPVGGTVTRLWVEPGDRVKAGQPLAVITSGELAELRVESLENSAERQGAIQHAQSDLQLAQQNYDRQQQIARMAIAQAKTELKVAQEQYDRDKDLAAQGAIPRREFLESEAHLATAKKALAEAESQLEVLAARTEVEQAQSSLQVAQSRSQLSAKTYQTRLQQLGATANPDGTITIKAPIAGTIADRQVTLGQSAEDAGSVLMTIVDDRTVLATANIYEKDLNQIKQGQQVRVTVASLSDRVFEGRITTIGSVVEGESRVVPVKAELNNADGVLKPGMFAELEVLTQQIPKPVLVIPKSAILEANGQPIVFVQNGNTFQPVEVILGRESGHGVEVESGLFEGDRLVTQRAAQLYAQSLRGDSTKPTEEPEMVEIRAKGGLLSWRWVIPASGLLAIGTFTAGVFWTNYRNRRQVTPDIYPFESLKESNQRHPAASSAVHEAALLSTETHRPDAEV